MVEPMGSDQLVWCASATHPVSIACPPRLQPRRASPCRIRLPPDKLNLFDARSGGASDPPERTP